MPLSLPPAFPVKVEGRCLACHLFNIQFACAVCISLCLSAQGPTRPFFPSPVILKLLAISVKFEARLELSLKCFYSLVLDHVVQNNSHLLSLQSMVFEDTSALFLPDFSYPLVLVRRLGMGTGIVQFLKRWMYRCSLQLVSQGRERLGTSTVHSGTGSAPSASGHLLCSLFLFPASPYIHLWSLLL